MGTHIVATLCQRSIHALSRRHAGAHIQYFCAVSVLSFLTWVIRWSYSAMLLGPIDASRSHVNAKHVANQSNMGWFCYKADKVLNNLIHLEIV